MYLWRLLPSSFAKELNEPAHSCAESPPKGIEGCYGFCVEKDQEMLDPGCAMRVDVVQRREISEELELKSQLLDKRKQVSSDCDDA